MTARTQGTALDMATWVARESMVFQDEDSPFRATLTTGAPKIVVVTGENASGKSLFTRILGAKAHGAGAVAVSLSIRERTGGGSAQMGRLAQMVMYGDEAEQSTGAASARAVSTAFKNLDRPEGSLLLLDEPEIGLSDGYARAMGEHIGTSLAAIPDVCAGVVVVSHSRSLINGLRGSLDTDPTWVHVSADGADDLGVGVEQPATLTDWLNWEERRTVDDLLALPATGHARFRSVHRLIKQ